jgi:hypothetical protein
VAVAIASGGPQSRSVSVPMTGSDC